MTTALDAVTRSRLAPEIEALAKQFEGTFGIETIERYLAESLDHFDDVRVQTFLPIFVRRFACDRLQALAQSTGAIVTGIPEVLFVCVHNAGRSQMAAALLAHHAQGRVNVRSAGSAPADEINPAVVEAMAEIGIDITQEFPKPLTDEFARAADVLVTMGCGDACPVYPGKRYLDWELPDPAGQGTDAVRPIRDEIDRRVKDLLAELTS
ncbi:MAG: Arsenate reductase thioredoxin-coupled [uncultured Acidimicrobiales bacterium]|uniref:Arsenate reductase thioredoxin-coupled n=1 Tax=uncultured Acidimicrobiales bacterium TaxID=310071 RepID=A0A6J4J9X0_9ACTN|nr:MAG: Arsenate reductase thioredoxin-coupled [uncultured Acidimicrobiales bacterium]